jgi:beta-N-acetylhexosaminidase
LLVRNSTLKIIGIILCLMIVMSCASKEELKQTNDVLNNGVHSEPSSDSELEKPDPAPVQTDSVMEQLGGMTLDEKIGQMIMVGIEGTVAKNHAKELIEKYHVGGIILFKKNMKSSEQILQLLNDLKEMNSNNIPLFLSVDQEGGRVSRLPAEFINIPTSQTIGKVDNEDFSYAIGEIIGEQLSAFGLNMNYAPVLDINSNPKNPVIGDRSYGSTIEVVRRQGIQVMKGMQAQRVIPVVKHFPGHGDTSVDSHVDIPVVTKSLDQLRELEWIPFVDAVNQQAEAVMVAHILMAQIDDQNPASLSKAVVTEVLRKELNFKGVVITDDMTMGAVSKHYDIGEASVKAVNAGNDIIMIAHDHDKELAAIHSIQQAVKEGAIAEETINQSVYRILKLKQEYNLTNEKVDSIDVDSINLKVNDILDTYLKN